MEIPASLYWPTVSGRYLNPKIDSIFKDEKVIVIQHGINQSGRADWNREHDEKVSNNLNIESFEIRWIKE